MILNIKSKISGKSYTVSYEGQLLRSIYTSDDFTSDQWIAIMNAHQPFVFRSPKEWRKLKNIIVTEVILEITFEEMWNRYGLKRDKPNAIKEWEKLSEEDRCKAYNNVHRFKNNLGTIAPPYLCRYLKYRRFEDEN